MLVPVDDSVACCCMLAENFVPILRFELPPLEKSDELKYISVKILKIMKIHNPSHSVKDFYIYGQDTLFDVALRYGIRGHLTSLSPMIIRRRFYLF